MTRTVLNQGLYQIKRDHPDEPCWNCQHDHDGDYSRRYFEAEFEAEFDPELAATQPHP